MCQKLLLGADEYEFKKNYIICELSFKVYHSEAENIEVNFT